MKNFWGHFKAQYASINQENKEIYKFADTKLEERYKNLCMENNLDLNLMDDMMDLLKINQKGNNVGIKKLDYFTFQKFVFHVMEDKGIVRRIYNLIEPILGTNEAFRRMLALSKQVVQNSVPHMRDQLEQLHEYKPFFEDSKSGLFEKTFDMFGFNGLTVSELQNQSEITNESYKVNRMKVRNDSEEKKYSDYVAFFGENEALSRSPPRVHVEWEVFANQIDKSNYRKVTKLEQFIQSIETNGISMNRILTVILVLGLEDDNWLKQIKDARILYYMSKILYKVILKDDFNYLPWNETPERNWLINHYSEKYVTNFKNLIGRLHGMRKEIMEETPAAFTDIDDPNIKNSHFHTDNVMKKFEHFRQFFCRFKNVKEVENSVPQLMANRFTKMEPELKKLARKKK
jgi:hypothetical protein